MLEFKKEDNIIFFMIGLLFIISVFIIKSFIIILMFTFILVYILNPIYKKLKKILKLHLFASLFIILTFLLIFILPISYAIIELSNEINVMDQGLVTENLNFLNEKVNQLLNINVDFTKQYFFFIEEFNIFIQNLIFKVPVFVFDIFLIVFFYYYFSKEHSRETKFFKTLVGNQRFKYIKYKLKGLLDGIIYGQIFVRFIQAATATLGFLILGVDSGILWGTVTFFAAFLPIIGTGLVWGPLMILAFLQSDYWMSFFILIIGVIVSSIDNILLPYIISERTNIGPVVTLISIVGGIEVFGLYGILLGPFFLGFLFVLIEELFIEMRRNNAFINRKHHVWTQEERMRYKNLKTQVAKDEFAKMINKKYDMENIKIEEKLFF